ncbi:hypothetical protein NC652_008256 [Populus alba x Populus x berolinensis]|nr:hypothetical protein NC652_008256 [Populus alba x Populus x berolinensis]
MNDLVFVMCNLKLNNNQVKKQADGFGVEDDLSSDDDWITEGEKHSNIDLLGAIDIATRRKNDNEDESDEEEIPNDAEMESQNACKSIINTLAGALYKVFYASPDEARKEIHQTCFDYLSLGVSLGQFRLRCPGCPKVHVAFEFRVDPLLSIVCFWLLVSTSQFLPQTGWNALTSVTFTAFQLRSPPVAENSVAFEFRVILLEHHHTSFRKRRKRFDSSRVSRYSDFDATGCRNSDAFEFRVDPYLSMYASANLFYITLPSANGETLETSVSYRGHCRLQSDAPIAEIQLPLNFGLIPLEHFRGIPTFDCPGCPNSVASLKFGCGCPSWSIVCFCYLFLTSHFPYRNTAKHFDSVSSRGIPPSMPRLPKFTKGFDSVSFAGHSDLDFLGCRNSVDIRVRLSAAFRLRMPRIAEIQLPLEFRVILMLEHVAFEFSGDPLLSMYAPMQLVTTYTLPVIPLEACMLLPNLFYITLAPPQTAKRFDSVSFTAFRLRFPDGAEKIFSCL